VTVLRHAKNRTRAMTVAPRVGIVGLLGQGNLGNDGSLEAVLAYLDAEHPDAILDFLCTGTDQMMARYGVPETRLRWYNTQTQRAPGVTAFAAKSLMVPLGMIVDAFRIGTWVRCHDVVMVPGMGVIETSLPLRSWHTPYSRFLVSAFGRLFGTKVALVSVGANDIRQPLAHRPQLGPPQIAAEPVSSIDELMRQIASVDTVVPSRFHNVLCALKLAKPTLSVGYAAKFGVLMEEVGLAEFCQSAHSVDVDRLIEQFTELESRSTRLQQMIMERTAANVRLLNHQFATLSALLFRSAEPEDAAAGHEHTRTDPFLGEVL
jgi:polysaccharide pyruvyl transferase WcaK-like protein